VQRRGLEDSGREAGGGVARELLASGVAAVASARVCARDAYTDAARAVRKRGWEGGAHRQVGGKKLLQTRAHAHERAAIHPDLCQRRRKAAVERRDRRAMRQQLLDGGGETRAGALHVGLDGVDGEECRAHGAAGGGAGEEVHTRVGRLPP